MSNPQQSPASTPRKSSTSTPSLFNNEYSQGPLYQYWRERNRESVEVRERRVLDAKERARGQKPLKPEPGPSSNSEYQGRLSRGLIAAPTPAYEATDSHTTARREAGVVGDDLPAYQDVNAHLAERAPLAADRGEFAQNATGEKERLQSHLAGLDAGEEGEGVMQESAPEVMDMDGRNKGKRKSISKGMGNFFGRAFTGYGLKSDGKMNENRW